MRKQILTVILSGIAMCTLAQGRIIPLTDLPASASVLATANSRAGNQSSAYIYTNPAAMFGRDTKTEADYSFALQPVRKGPDYTVHTLTAAQRLGKNALFVGARYMNMGTLKTFVDENMQETERSPLALSSYTIDAGYARRLAARLAAYATIGYATQHTLTHISAWHAGIGIALTDSLHLGNRPLTYNLNAAATNLGRYAYGDNNGSLSPRLSLGGSTTLQLSPRQQLSLYIDAAQYLAAENEKPTTEISTALAYRFCRNYQLSTGTHFGDTDNFIATGLSTTFGMFTLNAAIKWPIQTGTNRLYMAELQIDI